jgi:predicted GH43/DUF377 family glycosyl hydrolase
MVQTSRRTFLSVATSAAFGATGPVAIPEGLKTPHKVNRLVIPPSGDGSAFDSKGADVPFVFRHQERFHMTYVGFDGDGYQTGLATSTDLVNWKKKGLILRRDPASEITRYNVALTWIMRENDLFSPGRLKPVNGRYLGTYHAYPRPGYEVGPAAIGLCWSSDLREWELEPPCLHGAEGEPWEQGGLYKSCILEHDGVYYLYYNAKNRAEKWKEQTGFATSNDLKTWTRFPGNPVIRNGAAGAPDEKFCSDPCVLRYDGRWAIFYFGLDTQGVARDLLALSPDLRGVTKCSGYLIDVGPKGSVDSKYAHKPSLIYHEGVLYHLYCAVSEEHGRGISVATSVPL